MSADKVLTPTPENTNRTIRAIDYVREHCIEQKLLEFIGQVVHDRPDDPYGVLANQFSNHSDPPTINCINSSVVLNSQYGACLRHQYNNIYRNDHSLQY